MHFYCFRERFGVHWVNFDHPDRPRIPKNSAIELKKIFADNGFPADSENDCDCDNGSAKIVVGLITYVFAFAAFMCGRLF